MRVEKNKNTEPDASGSDKPARGHVHERVLRHMRQGLMVGAFLPGQVMSLRKLGASLGTSPMPVREVLSRLVAATALEETKGGSVRVPRLTPDKLADLFGVREVLEGMAAEMASRKATPELVEELAEINDRLHIAIDKRDIHNCLLQNQRFHFRLYEAAGSEVLMPLIESLWLQCGPTMYLSLLIPSMPWDASSHEHILAALKLKSAAAAKKGIVQDVRGTLKALLSVSGMNGVELPFTQGFELQFDH
ncbi:MAG: GntR family transcriptional regulator [Rhizobiaceae bacterium]